MQKYTMSVFKDMYYHELSAKEAIHARVAVPLAALSIIATLTIYYFSESKSLPTLSLTSVLLILYYLNVMVIFVLVVYSAYLMFKIVYGHRYGHTPTPKDIQDYVNKLGACRTDEELEKEFNEFLNDTYRDAAEDNRKNNHEKVKCIRQANLCIIIALILSLFNAIPLYFLK